MSPSLTRNIAKFSAIGAIPVSSAIGTIYLFLFPATGYDPLKCWAMGAVSGAVVGALIAGSILLAMIVGGIIASPPSNSETRARDRRP